MTLAHLLWPSLLLTTLYAAQAQSTSIVLPDGGRTVSIALRHQLGSDDAYQVIAINQGSRTFYFEPKNPVSEVPLPAQSIVIQPFSETTPGLHLDRSCLFAIGEYKAAHSRQTLLFFYSPAAAGEAAPLFVLGFLFDGTPYKVFEQTFALQALLQADQRAILIGKATVSHSLGCLKQATEKSTASTYDPFAAYEIRPSIPARYLLEASHKYNQARYVWAGPHSREDLAVVSDPHAQHHFTSMPASHLGEALGPCQ